MAVNGLQEYSDYCIKRKGVGQNTEVLGHLRAPPEAENVLMNIITS